MPLPGLCCFSRFSRLSPPLSVNDSPSCAASAQLLAARPRDASNASPERAACGPRSLLEPSRSVPRPFALASLLSSPCSLFLLAAERPRAGQGLARRGPGGALTAARGRAPHRAAACGRARCAGAREGGKRWQEEQKAGPGSSAGLTVLITGWEHTEADPSCQQPADLGRKGGEQGPGRAQPRFNPTPLQATGSEAAVSPSLQSGGGPRGARRTRWLRSSPGPCGEVSA